MNSAEEIDIPVRDDAAQLHTFARGDRVLDCFGDIGIDVANKAVVDLGAGYGSLSIAAAKAGATSVAAVDIYPERLAAIAARAKEQGAIVGVVEANLLDGVPEVRDADLVLLIGVVEYAGLWERHTDVRALQRRVFQTAFDCLKPGGQLVFASKNRLWPRFILRDANTRLPLVNVLPRKLADLMNVRLTGEPYRHHIHSPRGWSALIEAAGLEPAAYYLPFLSYQLPLQLSRRPKLSDIRRARARIQTREEFELSWGGAGWVKALLMVICGALRLPVAHSVIVVARKPTTP